MPGTDASAALPAHFKLLDAVRGLAALVVVVFHYHHFYLADYLGRSDLPPVESFPYAALLAPLYRNGGHAVELFWVISGFVFVHVYLHRQTHPRSFIAARFARLYPLHFLTLIIVALLQILSLAWVGHWQIYGNNDLRHFLLQLVMSSNWSSLSRGPELQRPHLVRLAGAVRLRAFPHNPASPKAIWPALCCPACRWDVDTERL